MKSSIGFWKQITEMLPAGIPPGAVAQLKALNPERIHLENVRSILGVSASRARLVCETAVRRGILSKRLLILCPDGSVAATADSESDVPPAVRCWREDDDSEMMPTQGLRRLEIYSFRG
jgi:hypothetical protein